MRKSSSALIKLLPIFLYTSIFAGRSLHHWLLRSSGFNRCIFALEFAWAISFIILVTAYFLLKKAKPKVGMSKKRLTICMIVAFVMSITGAFLSKWVLSVVKLSYSGDVFQFAFQIIIGFSMTMIGLWLINCDE